MTITHNSDGHQFIPSRSPGLSAPGRGGLFVFSPPT
jgi:hypothetical protein